MLQDNMKILRLKNRLQQDDVALELNVTKQTICNWEKGKRLPNINQLVKLATLYGVTIDELVGTDKRNKSIEVINLVTNLQDDTKEKLLDFLKVATN